MYVCEKGFGQLEKHSQLMVLAATGSLAPSKWLRLFDCFLNIGAFMLFVPLCSSIEANWKFQLLSSKQAQTVSEELTVCVYIYMRAVCAGVKTDSFLSS